MAAQLIWIAAVYAAAVVLVHLLHRRSKSPLKGRFGKRIHYIVVTRNHEAVLEWYTRVLGIEAFVTGKNIRITVLDDGSTDGTLRIAAKLALISPNIELGGTTRSLEEHSANHEDQRMTLDLRSIRKGDLPPFMRIPEGRGYESTS
ncbi:glycosyltransferase family A protein [Paenibacillus sp. NFR01]|uniref:glycosyltransferase family A protein n=1 Tax=Paenibacillus sp. NFR01 TaxID=1566279 RepID=UPI0008D104E9|nr:glycosyltransferase family A protein [Paenibacillus sp. NFR01]SEU14062.1 Glycosyl transferase family 2 [Paenibacillus sp. NFR01]